MPNTNSSRSRPTLTSPATATTSRQISTYRKRNTHFSLSRFTTAAAATTALLSSSSTFTSTFTFTSAFSLNMSMSASTSSSSSSSSIPNKKSKSNPINHPLSQLGTNFNHSWIEQLSTETDENRFKSKKQTPHDDGTSNNIKRPVYNGQYVLVKPDPLLHPRLVIHSKDVAYDLGITNGNDDHDDNDVAVQSDAFVKFFSGDIHAAFKGFENEINIQSWATPYALSIMGKRYTSNCPFGTGDGYGDGRAISIGEVLVDNTKTSSSSNTSPSRYELQLKGAGPTPFCRGADGRAVLRSSIREFLASEAMHYLGIQTTRALSLIVSDKGSTSQRPWYSDNNNKSIPTIDDPRLAKYSLEQRKQIVAQLNAQTKNDPDIMIEEQNAITCRVAPSFVRVGHIDLFARRVMKNVMDDNTKPDSSTNEFKELEELVWHACFREYATTCYDPFKEKNDLLSASKCLLKHSMDGISSMVAGWIRVGFAQGNFNADNCLVAGRTMDYGPFGFMDEYHPLFAKWTGSGDHFAFMNQMNAGFANYAMLVASVMPIIEVYSDSMEEAQNYREEIMEEGKQMFEDKLFQVLRSKLGFHPEDESVDLLWNDLESLLRESRADWTVFWRQLTLVAKEFAVTTTMTDSEEESVSFQTYADMFDVLCADDEVKQGSSPFYEKMDNETQTKLLKWIQNWREALVESYKEDGPSTILSKEDGSFIAPEERMRLANPKYILRESMLVEAYTKASPSNIRSPMLPFVPSPSETDESMIHELFELIQNPYEEGSKEQDRKYYRRAPDSALTAGGTAFMS